MIVLEKTDASNADFVALVKRLDDELAVIDGDDHDFYHQFNKIDGLKYVLLASLNDEYIGCGAIKPFDPQTMEVKRMYVNGNARGKGYATIMLLELEKWAKDLGYHRCLLETGIRQADAVALYKKNKYQVIDNYGQYTGVQNSVCFEKQL